MSTQHAPVPATPTSPGHTPNPLRAAIGFAVLILVGAVLMMTVPDEGEGQVARYLSDDAKQVRAVVGCFIWTGGVCCLLFFATYLRGVLREAEGKDSGLADV